MIRHRCPLCEHVIASSDDVVGLTIRCPACEATHRVPAESEPGVEAVALAAPLPELEREPGLFEEVWADVTGTAAAPDKEVSPVATEEPCAVHDHMPAAARPSRSAQASARATSRRISGVSDMAGATR